MCGRVIKYMCAFVYMYEIDDVYVRESVCMYVCVYMRVCVRVQGCEYMREWVCICV